MKYKHIIWDYNGTILDDTQLVLDILNKMLEEKRLKTCTMDEYREVFDFPIIDYYINVGFDLEKYSFEELADQFTDMYEQMFEKSNLRNGIVEMMKKFHEEGFEQSILTAGREKNIGNEIKAFGLDKYIKEITGLNNNKAESKVFLAEQHLEKIKVKPEEILFIGDTTHDYLVAQEIGCDCVLLSGGHQSMRRLQAVCEMVAERPEDIEKYL
ncbi:MAG: HAD family hydrolase [Eubacteriales bacterium]